MSLKVFVESVDEENAYDYGILAYQVVTEHFLNDLQITAIDNIRIIIDQEAPFFFIQITLGKGSEPPKTIADVAEIKVLDDGIHITIRDETYAPPLLRFLWAKLGRDNVDQLDRWESVIPLKSIPLLSLRTSVIFDPVQVIMDKISDFIYRIVPEGFRVQMNLSNEEQLSFIFSENVIDEKWLATIDEILQRSPRPIPAELLIELKKAPRTIYSMQKKFDKLSYTRKILTPWKTYYFEEFTAKEQRDKVKFLSNKRKKNKKKKENVSNK